MQPSRSLLWICPLLLLACLEGDPNPYDEGEGTAGSPSGSAGTTSGSAGTTSGSACSTESVTPVNITFVNTYADRSLMLVWVDYGCGEVQYGAIGAGMTHTQTTFVTHPWRLYDASNGALVREFVATSGNPVTVTVP